MIGTLARCARGLARRTEERVFEAVQIEVTSRCNIRCVMCPVTELADRWHSQHLPWDVFLRLAPALRRVKFVHLQGWGEPLLHPRLFDMIEMAKDAGCRVGFTTNGTLLRPAAAERLLDLDLDLLAVSIAGATPATHAAIRVGSDLSQILTHVRGLLDLRARRASLRPKVEIFFLMTKTNLAELPAAASLAASLGADELVATNLDYVPAFAQDDLKAFASASRRETFARAVEEARRAAKAAGIAFRAYPLDPEEVAVCEANPLKNLFVSSDGWVSPCTYMGLAGQTEIPRVAGGQLLPVPRLRFGDVRERDLLEIWNAPAYEAFRQQFAARRTAGLVSAIAAVARVGTGSAKVLPAAPEPCRSCPKLYGL